MTDLQRRTAALRGVRNGAVFNVRPRSGPPVDTLGKYGPTIANSYFKRMHLRLGRPPTQTVMQPGDWTPQDVINTYVPQQDRANLLAKMAQYP